MLLSNALSNLLALFGTKVRLGIEILRVSLLYFFRLLFVFHLHAHELLVFQVLKFSHLLLNLKGLLFRSYLILELLLLDFFLHAKMLKLVLYTLLGIRFSHLVVLIELLSLHFMVVVYRVRALRTKKSWDLLIVTRRQFLGILLLAHVQGTSSSIPKCIRHFPFTLKVSRINLLLRPEVWHLCILLELT